MPNFLDFVGCFVERDGLEMFREVQRRHCIALRVVEVCGSWMGSMPLWQVSSKITLSMMQNRNEL